MTPEEDVTQWIVVGYSVTRDGVALYQQVIASPDGRFPIGFPLRRMIDFGELEEICLLALQVRRRTGVPITTLN